MLNFYVKLMLFINSIDSIQYTVYSLQTKDKNNFFLVYMLQLSCIVNNK
jgi:hypothetical protein